VDPSAGGTASSSATAVEGSSPSQDRSVDFLQKYTIGCQSSSTTTPSTTREGSALTSLTGLSSRSGHRGCWKCLPVYPRRAFPLAPRRPLPPPWRRQPVQRPPALLRPPLLQWRGLRVPCPPEEQGAGAPAAPITLQQWGLGYDSQPAPPLYPTRLRRPDQRAPSAAPPASKRKPGHQQMNSIDGYSTTLVKTSYLLRRGL
jgi:hypothetical protein